MKPSQVFWMSFGIWLYIISGIALWLINKEENHVLHMVSFIVFITLSIFAITGLVGLMIEGVCRLNEYLDKNHQ